MSENGEIYSAGKNFTLPPALTAWTNSTFAPFRSDGRDKYHLCIAVQKTALSLEKFLVANCTQVYFNKHKRNAFVGKCKTENKMEFP